MRPPHLSIRLDFANGGRIGPGKIALLEAIRVKGSIRAAAQHSFRAEGLLPFGPAFTRLNVAFTESLGPPDLKSFGAFTIATGC
jgi:hypothetical protein